MRQKDKDLFFQELAAESGYLEPSLVKAVYIALVRLLLKKMRERGGQELPDFGKIRVVRYKERRIGDPNTGLPVVIPARRVVKFTPDYKLRDYIDRMADNQPQ